MKYIIKLTLLILLLLPSVAFGATYYVAQSSAGSGNGSSYANRMSVASHNSGSFSGNDIIYLSGSITSQVIPPSSGTSSNRIVYDGNDGVNPAANINYSSSSGAIKLNTVNYLTFQDIEMSGGTEGFCRWTTAISSYITIKRCTIHGMTNRGFVGGYIDNYIFGGASGDGNTIYNCGVNTAGGDIDLGGSNVTNILISHNHLYGNGVDEGVDGVVLQGSSDVIIEYNKIHDHWREDGIDLKYSCHNITIRYNDIYGHTAQTGITVQMGSYDVYIYGNSIHGNTGWSGIGIAGGYGSGLSAGPVYIWSNLIYDNLVGIKTQLNTGALATKSVYIYNNVIAENGDVSDNLPGISIGSVASGEVVVCKNNIFYKNTSSSTYRQIYVQSGLESRVTLDYNIYYYTNQTPTIYWSGSDRTLAVLKSTYSQEANGFETGPNFTDAGNNDYTLLTASPAIDAGVNLGASYDDCLHPTNTDWSTTPPTVGVLDQDDLTPWEIGAYGYPGSPQNTAPYVTVYSPGGDTTIYHDVADTITANCTAVDDEGDTISYLWTFENGTPATTTDEDPSDTADPSFAWLGADTYSCSLKVTDEHGLFNTYNFIVTHEANAPVDNNFTGDCIAWYILNSDVTDSESTNDLTAYNSPTYADGGIVLNGTTQHAAITDLDDDISDLSIFAKFKFDAELANGTIQTLASELDTGADKRVWAISIYGESDGDDVISIDIGHTNGEARDYLLHTSDLDHATVYTGVLTYNQSADETKIYVLNADGSTKGSTAVDSDFFEVGETQNIESVPFLIGTALNSGSATNHLDGVLYEVALLNRTISANEVNALASSQFPLGVVFEIISISIDGTYSIDATLTVAGVFKRKTSGDTYVPLDTTWTDSVLPYAFLTCETGATDLRLYHSYPASGVAGSIHYFSTHATDANYINSMIAAGMASADLVVNSLTSNGGTWTYGSPAINCDVTLPSSPNRLQDNAAIVIDTTQDTMTDTLWCNCSTGAQKDDYVITVVGQEMCVLWDFSGAEWFVDGPLGDLTQYTNADYGFTYGFKYRSPQPSGYGVGYDKWVLTYTTIAGDRKDGNLGLAATISHTITDIIDAGSNEIANYNTAALGNTATVEVPKDWTIGTDKDYVDLNTFETGLYGIPGDHLRILNNLTELQTFSSSGSSEYPIVLNFNRKSANLNVTGNHVTIRKLRRP